MTNDEQVSSGALTAGTANQNQLNGFKGGKPVKLTRNVAKIICSTVSNSRLPLNSLCEQNDDWPAYRTLTDGIYRYPWFASMLARAREEQADFLAQDTIALEQNLLADPRITMPQVQAHKVVMDNRHWYAGKILKRVYGDDNQINVDARTAVVVGDEQLKDLRSRLDQAKQLVKGKTSTADSKSTV